jgi:hypothetical protein
VRIVRALLQTHPDHHGFAEDFRRVKQGFDDLCRLLERRLDGADARSGVSDGWLYHGTETEWTSPL